MTRRVKKKGTILVENIVFIILNLLFLVVLVLFLVKQGSGAVVLEQTYSKQIAMIADLAKPGMIIKMDMTRGKTLADSNGFNFNEVVRISDNAVRVKLSSSVKAGYTYSFFNDVNVLPQALKDEKGEYTGMYMFTVSAR